MKNIQNSLFIMFVGLVFLAFGYGPSLFAMANYNFNCNRHKGNKGVCEFSEKTLVSSKYTVFKINEIKEVKVYKSRFKVTCSYNVNGYLANGRTINLSGRSTHSLEPDMKEYAEKINSFITNHNQNKLEASYMGEIQVDSFFSKLGLVGGIVLIVGLLVFISSVKLLFKCKNQTKNKKEAKKEAHRGPIMTNDNDDRNKDIFLN